MLHDTRKPETMSGFRLMQVSEVTDMDWRQWTEILEKTPALHSPFLRPEFVQCVAAIHTDVHVARWEAAGELAYFAFHRKRRTAQALGFGLAEWQAAVTPRTTRINWRELVQRLQTSALHFDHFYSWQMGDAPSVIHGASPYMDLSQGMAAYLARRKQLGNSLIQQTQRKGRKLERECGPLELQYDAPVNEALECLFRWKRLQHHRTGVRDAFAEPKITRLLAEVAHCRSDTFRGRISWLKCGGKPIAVHLGVETTRTSHMWYPAYDPQWSSYSPGNVMFLRLAEAMAEAGLARFDFGPGGQSYKERLSTDAESVSRGVLDSRWLIGRVRQQADWFRRRAAAVKHGLTNFAKRPFGRFRGAAFMNQSADKG